MAITRNQVIAVLPQILTPDIRSVIRQGIEDGLVACDTLDESNREVLGDYAANIQTRNLFSAICAELQNATTNPSRCISLRLRIAFTESAVFLTFSALLLSVHFYVCILLQQPEGLSGCCCAIIRESG